MRPITSTLSAVLLVSALAACSQNQTPGTDAPATAPAPAASGSTDSAADNAADSAANSMATAQQADGATAEAEAGSSASNADANTAASAPAPAPVASANPYVEGRDYRRIENGQPFEPKPGTIEVVEVFGYTCPACAAFQPQINAWKARMPADVNFVYVPAAFGGAWDEFARAFYAAEALGVVDRTHEAMYNAVHQSRSIRGGEDIAKFYQQNANISTQQFNDTLGSFAVNTRINRAKQFLQRSTVDATPTIIVNGKYVVLGRDRLAITDALIQQERAAQAAQQAPAQAAQ